MTRDNQFISKKELKLFNSSSYLALCPLDGRYAQIATKLAPYFSEYALAKKRVEVEVNWLIFLVNHLNRFIKPYTSPLEYGLTSIFNDFDKSSFEKIKEFESKTNHDVKAVEYFICDKLDSLGLSELKSFVHFGCTSEDINNAAYAQMIKTALKKVWIPAAKNLINHISQMADANASVAMLAHTHGQPATPTTVGKEFLVFSHRLSKSLENVKSIKPCAKFNGATGNYSALSIAYPNENWDSLCKYFVENYLILDFNPVTTQIESHDYVCHLADAIRHFNNILLDLNLDMWMYISMEYFKQIPVKDEVGSSTMPHKVNPIRFENSEANIDMSNSVLMSLSNKLPRSRMQRDLSDSSTMRNIGLAFGYSLQAIEQTLGGLKKVVVNHEKLASDLNDKWEVLAEPIQTMLRKYGIPDAYEKLKELTRGKKIDEKMLSEFINSLDMLSEDDKNTLLYLRPEYYTGLAESLVYDNLK